LITGFDEICLQHGIVSEARSTLAQIEAVAKHSENCSCSMRWNASEPSAFEAELVHRAGESFYLYVPFSFDGLIPTVTLATRQFTLPNVETLTEVLFRMASDSLSWGIQMVSGDEMTVATLFSNFMEDEIQIDGFKWIDGKPVDRECILKYAFDYFVIGDSESPGAEETGWSALCQFQSQMWIYHSDAEEWSGLGEITREAAIGCFRNDSAYLQNHSDEYQYSDDLQRYLN